MTAEDRQMEPHEHLLPELKDLIAKYGWAVRHVLGAPDGVAPFSYTVGLTAIGCPELVVTGLPTDVAHEFLNLAADLMRDGRRFRSGQRTPELADDGEILFIDAEDTSGLTAVEDLYGTVVAQQLVWPDSSGAFPWQDGHRNSASAQPLLGPIPESPGTVVQADQ